MVAWGCVSAAFAEDLPGATLRDRAAGWSASLFVAPPAEPHRFADAAPPVAVPPVVNFSVSKLVGKNLSLGFDVSNVFDQPTPRENWFYDPPRPRGFVLQLRKTF